MEKFLFVETAEGAEIVPLEDQELLVIKPLLHQIAMDKYRTVKSNGHYDDDDYGKYGHLPGFETLVQFIPDGGINAIKAIKVLEEKETLLA